MKRSRTVKRLLLGSLCVGLAASAASAEQRVTPDNFYTNDHLIPGAGYYHAPFQAFYPHPYNYFDPQRRLYFFGGQWGPTPHRSIVNISTPTVEAATRAQNLRTDRAHQPVIIRHGFGGTSRSHSIRS